MIILGRGVVEFVKKEAEVNGIKCPAVLIMDCGCMMNEGDLELDIREEGSAKDFELFMEKDGLKFFISPKAKHLAKDGKIMVVTYAAGRLKRIAFTPV